MYFQRYANMERIPARCSTTSFFYQQHVEEIRPTNSLTYAYSNNSKFIFSGTGFFGSLNLEDLII